MLMQASFIDPFSAYKPALRYKDTTNIKKCPLYGALGSQSADVLGISRSEPIIAQYLDGSGPMRVLHSSQDKVHQRVD